jgi:hypothetical protein
MTKKKKVDDANAKPSADGNSAKTDERLKSILPVIETQPMPVKEALADFAKAMLTNTNHLNHRIMSLNKFSPTTMVETTTNEPQPQNNLSSFIPRSARINIKLKYSNATANDTSIKGLEEKLEELNKNFTQEVTNIFKSCAELEVKNVKENRIKTFLSYTHKITQALILFEKINVPLTTTLNDLQFSIWTVVIFLRKVKLILPQPGDPYFYGDYLKMEYQNVKEILLNNFISEELVVAGDIENKQRSESEKFFQDKVVDKLKETILPVTIHLQTTINKEEKYKKTASQLTAQFKKDAILTATEATAIAITDTSKEASTNMEQHIKKLINEVLKKQAATSSKNNKKRKNSSGGKTPQPLPPPKENKGKTTSHQKKKQKVSQKDTNNNNDDEPASILKKKVRFNANSKNPKGPHEGKKKGGKNGNKKRKNN